MAKPLNIDDATRREVLAAALNDYGVRCIRRAQGFERGAPSESDARRASAWRLRGRIAEDLLREVETDA